MSRSKFTQERPPGIKFQPTDEELVGYYLLDKVCGREFAECEKSYVREFDLYGKQEPSYIWEKFHRQGHQDLFFITKLKHFKKKNGEKGSRIERKVGLHGGRWHGEDAPEEFNVFVGFNGTQMVYVTAIRKRFNYRNPGSDQHCLWIMHELSLKNNDEYVVCRLRKNIHGAKVVDAIHRGKKRVANFNENLSKKKMQKTVQYQNVPECHESELTICPAQLPTDPEKLQQFASDVDMFLLDDDLMNFTIDVDELWGDATSSSSEMNAVDTVKGIDQANNSSSDPTETPQCRISGTETEGFCKNGVANYSSIEPAQHTDDLPARWSDYFASVLLETNSPQRQECDIEMLPNGLHQQNMQCRLC